MALNTLQLVLRHATALAPADAAPDGELLRRFTGGDEAAFAELVRRHGPVVWAACRHLLPNPADAEDAFQVTFVALARSAHAVRNEAALGGWLHGVAVRAAARVRRDAARRRVHEQRAAKAEADRSVPEATWDALLAAVHEEVARLPDALRTAFVLCDLEGVRQPDAAAQLGWKPGTLTGRLTRARQRLIGRLAGRGLVPGVAGIAVTTAAAAVPAELGTRVAASCCAGGAVPPALLELVREVTPMALNWWAKRLAVAAVVAGGLGAAVFPVARAQPPGGSGAGAVGLRGLPTPTGPSGKLVPLPGGSGVGAPDGASGVFAPGPARTGWEYKYVEQRREVAAFKKTVSDLGAAGWEYCDHLDIHSGTGGPTDLLVFKRPAVVQPPPGGGIGPNTGGGGPGPIGPGAMSGRGGGAKAGPAGGEDTLVLRAKHARAAELGTTLREVFAGEAVTFTAEERTNSLIVRGDARLIERARALLAELDTPAAEPRGANMKR